ncbi:heavy metal-associated domain-containing protein [Fervidicella metallireducens AeB]|uniref:Heavy metal-associated domain-containing protein n=1 Tax=Fervidicella metallireducens AeB TaxID=1403537 RepID=A0A017RVZ9_9CLOT
MSIKKEVLTVHGMTCTACEERIIRSLSKMEGILSVRVKLSMQKVEIDYDTELCNIPMIKETLMNLGYYTENSLNYKIIGIFIIVAATLFLGHFSTGFDITSKAENASYFMLFALGFLTSIHCVGMCGGLMLSQSISEDTSSKFKAMKPALLYNAGRVISYTILGCIVGSLGSVISLSLVFKAGLQIFAGLFMIIMGFNIAGFNLFRRFLIHFPWSACSINKNGKGPFIVGILNGFIPCGPLQTMQIYALSTGSAYKGGVSMLAFALGTVPLMLTFGAVTGILSKNLTKDLVKLSGIFIIILGLVMGKRGLALAGLNISPMAILSNKKTSDISSITSSKAVIKDGIQTITITADRLGYNPGVVYVQKSIPVKWIINGKVITSCNNQIIVPSLGIQKNLEDGENIIEFTPEKTGDINYSCWMGMLTGVIRVVDDLSTFDVSNSSQTTTVNNVDCCAVRNLQSSSGKPELTDKNNKIDSNK